jgi:hypothetical protein
MRFLEMPLSEIKFASATKDVFAERNVPTEAAALYHSH